MIFSFPDPQPWRAVPTRGPYFRNWMQINSLMKWKMKTRTLWGAARYCLCCVLAGIWRDTANTDTAMKILLYFLLVEVGDADNECTYHIIGAHNLSSSSAWSSLSSILRGVEIDKAPFISIQELGKITRHPNTTEPCDASATWVQRECHNAQTTKWLLLFFFWLPPFAF